MSEVSIKVSHESGIIEPGTTLSFTVVDENGNEATQHFAHFKVYHNDRGPLNKSQLQKLLRDVEIGHTPTHYNFQLPLSEDVTGQITVEAKEDIPGSGANGTWRYTVDPKAKPDFQDAVLDRLDRLEDGLQRLEHQLGGLVK